MDFRDATLLGPRLQQMEDEAVEDAVLKNGKANKEDIENEIRGGPIGFDHNYVLHVCQPPCMRVAAVVSHAESGRTLTVETDAPGVQFYTANYLDKVNGKGGSVYHRHNAFCLETQHFPSSVCEVSPVTAEFKKVGGASPIISPDGPPYRHSIHYTFGQDATNEELKRRKTNN